MRRLGAGKGVGFGGLQKNYSSGWGGGRREEGCWGDIFFFFWNFLGGVGRTPSPIPTTQFFFLLLLHPKKIIFLVLSKLLFPTLSSSIFFFKLHPPPSSGCPKIISIHKKWKMGKANKTNETFWSFQLWVNDRQNWSKGRIKKNDSYRDLCKILKTSTAQKPFWSIPVNKTWHLLTRKCVIL